MKKVISILVCIGLIVSILVSCEGELINDNNGDASLDTSKLEDGIGDNSADDLIDIENNVYGIEQQQTEKNQKKLNEKVPAEPLTDSVERRNLNRRNKLWNDANKVSYIYLLSDYGTIICCYQIKGKVSSVNSKLNSDWQVVSNDPNYQGSDNLAVVDSPSMDGSYGSNGNAIFFFTTAGVYKEWPGLYLLSDKPEQLTTKPLLISEGD